MYFCPVPIGISYIEKVKISLGLKVKIRIITDKPERQHPREKSPILAASIIVGFERVQEPAM